MNASSPKLQPLVGETGWPYNAAILKVVPCRFLLEDG
jgi:hypothetical protein